MSAGDLPRPRRIDAARQAAGERRGHFFRICSIEGEAMIPSNIEPLLASGGGGKGGSLAALLRADAPG